MIKSGHKTQSQSCLSDECDLYCTLADSTFDALVKEIFNGDICIQDIEMVKTRKSQVLKLCSATTHAALDDFTYTLELRVKESDAFKHYKNVLDSFCREINVNLHIKGEAMLCCYN